MAHEGCWRCCAGASRSRVLHAACGICPWPACLPDLCAAYPPLELAWSGEGSAVDSPSPPFERAACVCAWAPWPLPAPAGLACSGRRCWWRCRARHPWSSMPRVRVRGMHVSTTRGLWALAGRVGSRRACVCSCAQLYLRGVWQSVAGPGGSAPERLPLPLHAAQGSRPQCAREYE